MKQVRKVRILPLATQEFVSALQFVIKEPSHKKEVLQELINSIKERLSGQNAKFLNRKYAEIELYERNLREALMQTFENRTIPAYIAGMEGNIYLDDKIVGRVKRSQLRETVYIQGKIKLKRIIGQCFRETVKLMSYLKKEVR